MQEQGAKQYVVAAWQRIVQGVGPEEHCVQAPGRGVFAGDQHRLITEIAAIAMDVEPTVAGQLGQCKGVIATPAGKVKDPQRLVGQATGKVANGHEQAAGGTAEAIDPFQTPQGFGVITRINSRVVHPLGLQVSVPEIEHDGEQTIGSKAGD